MKAIKRVLLLLKRTGTLKIIFGFFVVCLISAISLKLVEPGIKTVGDGMWYCFVASTTIGFGDIYATTLIGRIITVLVSICGLIVFAMMTGVIVTYHNEYLNNKMNETISLFLDKLENLPNLSKDELKEISDKVKKIAK